MKVVQLICNHQVVVRFRVGAPINQFVRVIRGVDFFPFFPVYPLCTRIRATWMHVGRQIIVDVDRFSVDYRYRHVELVAITPMWLANRHQQRLVVEHRPTQVWGNPLSVPEQPSIAAMYRLGEELEVPEELCGEVAEGSLLGNRSGCAGSCLMC